MIVRPMRAPAAVTATAGDETVVYDPVKDALHILDETASAAWSLLDGRRSIAEVADALNQRYGPSDAIRGDVHGLIATLRDAGLVTDEPPRLPVEGSLEAIQAGPETPPQGTLHLHASDSRAPSTRRRANPVFSPAASTSAPTGFVALGQVFTVEADDAALEAQACEMLRDLAAAAVTDPVRYRLRTVADAVAIDVDGEQVVAPVTAERLPHMLLWHINQEAVRRATERFVVLHAAAAERDGVAVILPAAMEHGKTTTVTGLVRAGYRYLSDELTVIDPWTLRLVPYAKPLGIDPGAQKLFADLRPAGSPVDGPWQVPASAIRPDALAAGGMPAVIVAPTYDPSTPTAAVPVSAAAMTVQLADCTFDFREHPRRDLAVLARLAEACACHRMTISNLDDAIRLIDHAVEGITRSRTRSKSDPGT